MRSPAFDELIRPIETVRRIVWFAFAIAIGAYVVVVFAFVKYGLMAGNFRSVLSNPLTLPLTVTAILAALVSPYLGGSLIPNSRLQEIFSREPDPEALARNPQTGAVNPERSSKIRTLSPAEQRLLSLAAISFVPFLIRLAVNESIALFGLVLSFLSHSTLPILPAAILSFALQLTVSPKLDSEFARASRLGLV